MSLDDELNQVLVARREQQLYRERYVSESATGAEVIIDGRRMLGFCSNDYLGLANHPEVIERLHDASRHFGVGSGASHLVYGHSEEHHQLELELAALTGRARALLFSTGYMANLGVITALLGRGDTVFEDRLNHASLIDAGVLSRAKFKRFAHSNVPQLQRSLQQAGDGRRLVVVDGVFSMDGDLAPLPELAASCQAHGAHLMIDDAHGFGIIGKHGGGCAEHFQLSTEELPIIVGTLGKAFGTFGAFVAGSDALIETLIQFSRSYIYTTALPPSVAAATRTSLQLLKTESWRRDRLDSLIAQFRLGARQLKLPLMDSFTPIQPLLLGDEKTALDVSQALRAHGILVGAIRPPTVPVGASRLRITLCANHNAEHVAQLLYALDRTVPDAVRVE